MLVSNKKLALIASIILVYLGGMPLADAGFQYRIYQPGVKPFEAGGGGGGSDGGVDEPGGPVLTHELLIATPTINFGTVGMATPVPSILFYLINTGTAPVFISNLEIDGSPDISALDYGCYQATLEPGTACQLSLGYDPVTIGPVSTNILITSDAQTPIQTITATGVGSTSDIPFLSPSQFSDYLVVASNSTTENLYSFHNYGFSSVTITNGSLVGDSAFSLVTNDCTLGTEIGAYASCGVSVRFSPVASTPSIARASLTVNISGKAATIQLVGKKL